MKRSQQNSGPRRDSFKKGQPGPRNDRREGAGQQRKDGQHRGAERRDVEIPKSWRAIAGTHAIREAFDAGQSGLKMIWIRQDWESNEDLREFEERAKQEKVRIEFKSSQVIDKFCATHQGAVAFASARPELDIESLEAKKTSVVLALDGLEDPHNLGAIIRTAWLTGADGILIPSDRAVGLTPTVHKVASGGAEHVPVEEVNQFAPTIERLKEKGYWVFGLSHKATKTLFDLKLPEKVVWAIGAEDKGLRITTERLCDELVSIPQTSDAASYNASVAAAMALTETYRQQNHNS